jgi:hypothetical protein
MQQRQNHRFFWKSGRQAQADKGIEKRQRMNTLAAPSDLLDRL